jgi:hypothetical protein
VLVALEDALLLGPLAAAHAPLAALSLCAQAIA